MSNAADTCCSQLIQRQHIAVIASQFDAHTLLQILTVIPVAVDAWCCTQQGCMHFWVETCL